MKMAVCALRYSAMNHIIKNGNPWNRGNLKVTINDPGCVGCQQGREIAKMVKKAEKAVEAVPEKKETPAGNGKAVVLDFSGYPDVYEKIRQVAETEFRTVPLQIMYWAANMKVGGQ